MTELSIRLDDLPAEGRELAIEDRQFWDERFSRHELGASAGEDIAALVHVQRQDGSALIRGRLTGSVTLPCDRCAERFEHRIEVEFDEFEPGPAEADGEESRIEDDRGVLTLDIGAVLWEQFVLALPVKPVCAGACKGVCPGCGANLNETDCSCEQEPDDPRLAVFRDLKLK